MYIYIYLYVLYTVCICIIAVIPCPCVVNLPRCGVGSSNPQVLSNYQKNLLNCLKKIIKHGRAWVHKKTPAMGNRPCPESSETHIAPVPGGTSTGDVLIHTCWTSKSLANVCLSGVWDSYHVHISPDKWLSVFIPLKAWSYWSHIYTSQAWRVGVGGTMVLAPWCSV